MQEDMAHILPHGLRNLHRFLLNGSAVAARSDRLSYVRTAPEPMGGAARRAGASLGTVWPRFGITASDLCFEPTASALYARGSRVGQISQQ